jgi:hypothetical protein
MTNATMFPMLVETSKGQIVFVQVGDPIVEQPHRRFVCGTRAVEANNPFRVVCASCGAGGTVKHPTPDAAKSACVRDSNRSCRSCKAR